MEGDIAQLQRLPVRMRLRPGKVGPVRGEGELTKLVKRHLGAEQRGQRADGGEQRRAQKQQRQGIVAATAVSAQPRLLAIQNTSPMAPSIIIFDQLTALRWKVSARTIWCRYSLASGR